MKIDYSTYHVILILATIIAVGYIIYTVSQTVAGSGGDESAATPIEAPGTPPTSKPLINPVIEPIAEPGGEPSITRSLAFPGGLPLPNDAEAALAELAVSQPDVWTLRDDIFNPRKASRYMWEQGVSPIDITEENWVTYVPESEEGEGVGKHEVADAVGLHKVDVQWVVSAPEDNIIQIDHHELNRRTPFSGAVQYDKSKQKIHVSIFPIQDSFELNPFFRPDGKIITPNLSLSDEDTKDYLKAHIRERMTNVHSNIKMLNKGNPTNRPTGEPITRISIKVIGELSEKLSGEKKDEYFLWYHKALRDVFQYNIGLTPESTFQIYVVYNKALETDYEIMMESLNSDDTVRTVVSKVDAGKNVILAKRQSLQSKNYTIFFSQLVTDILNYLRVDPRRDGMNVISVDPGDPGLIDLVENKPLATLKGKGIVKGRDIINILKGAKNMGPLLIGEIKNRIYVMFRQGAIQYRNVVLLVFPVNEGGVRQTAYVDTDNNDSNKKILEQWLKITEKDD